MSTNESPQEEGTQTAPQPMPEPTLAPPVQVMTQAQSQALAQFEGLPPATTRDNPNPLWNMPVASLFKLRELTSMVVWGLAQTLARSTLVDQKLQGKPANVFMLLLKAAALDVDVSTALDNFHIIETRDRDGNVKTQITIAAHLQFALVLRSGVMKVWRYTQSDDTVARMSVQRKEWAEPIEVEFTIEQANKLGLTGGSDRSPWQKQRANMLRRRVTTLAAREHAGDVVIAYDLEEIEGSGAAEGSQPAPTWQAAPLEPRRAGDGGFGGGDGDGDPFSYSGGGYGGDDRRPDDDVPDFGTRPPAPQPSPAPAPERAQPAPAPARPTSMTAAQIAAALVGFQGAAAKARDKRALDRELRALDGVQALAEGGDRNAAAAMSEAEKAYDTNLTRINRSSERRG